MLTISSKVEGLFFAEKLDRKKVWDDRK